MARFRTVGSGRGLRAPFVYTPIRRDARGRRVFRKAVAVVVAVAVVGQLIACNMSG